jgi:hypothetical protein
MANWQECVESRNAVIAREAEPEDPQFLSDSIWIILSAAAQRSIACKSELDGCSPAPGDGNVTELYSQKRQDCEYMACRLLLFLTVSIYSVRHSHQPERGAACLAPELHKAGKNSPCAGPRLNPQPALTWTATTTPQATLQP